MKKPTAEELAAFIAKSISYDESISNPGIKCPHCGKMARESAVADFYADEIRKLEVEVQT